METNNDDDLVKLVENERGHRLSVELRLVLENINAFASSDENDVAKLIDRQEDEKLKLKFIQNAHRLPRDKIAEIRFKSQEFRERIDLDLTFIDIDVACTDTPWVALELALQGSRVQNVDCFPDVSYKFFYLCLVGDIVGLEEKIQPGILIDTEMKILALTYSREDSVYKFIIKRTDSHVLADILDDYVETAIGQRLLKADTESKITISTVFQNHPRSVRFFLENMTPGQNLYDVFGLLWSNQATDWEEIIDYLHRETNMENFDQLIRFVYNKDRKEIGIFETYFADVLYYFKEEARNTDALNYVIEYIVINFPERVSSIEPPDLLNLLPSIVINRIPIDYSVFDNLDVGLVLAILDILRQNEEWDAIRFLFENTEKVKYIYKFRIERGYGEYADRDLDDNNTLLEFIKRGII